MTTTQCVTCGARTHQPDTNAWTPAHLDEPLEIHSTIDPDAPAYVIPAGLFMLCPPCTTWRPHARSAPLPTGVQQLVDAQVELFATLIGTNDARHALTAQQVGVYRHLARHLKPGHPQSQGGGL